MGWLVKGPWAVIKWFWAGIVLVLYVLFGVLSIFTWFTAEPTVYNNNPPAGRRNPDPSRKTGSETQPNTS